MAPSDEAELVHAVATAAAHDSGPIAFRYPRGEGVGVPLPEKGEVLPIGKGRVLREGSTVALIGVGTRVHECLKAAEDLAAQGLSATVVDPRFVKPLDTDLLRDLAARHEVIVTVEEGSSGGFGAMVLEFLSGEGLMDHGLKVRAMTMPDAFLEHDSPAVQIDHAGLSAPHIVAKVLSALGRRAGAAETTPARA